MVSRHPPPSIINTYEAFITSFCGDSAFLNGNNGWSFSFKTASKVCTRRVQGWKWAKSCDWWNTSGFKKKKKRFAVWLDLKTKSTWLGLWKGSYFGFKYTFLYVCMYVCYTVHLNFASNSASSLNSLLSWSWSRSWHPTEPPGVLCRLHTCQIWWTDYTRWWPLSASIG